MQKGQARISIRDVNEEFIFQYLGSLAFEYSEPERCGQLDLKASLKQHLETNVSFASMMTLVVFSLADLRLRRFFLDSEWEPRLCSRDLMQFSGFASKKYIPVLSPFLDYNPIISVFYNAAENSGVFHSGFPPELNVPSDVSHSLLNQKFSTNLFSLANSENFKKDLRVRLERASNCFDKCIGVMANMVRVGALRIVRINLYLLGASSGLPQPMRAHDATSKIFGKFINSIFKSSCERHGISGYINFVRYSQDRGLYYHCAFFVDADFPRSNYYFLHYLGNLWQDYTRRNEYHGSYDDFKIFYNVEGFQGFLSKDIESESVSEASLLSSARLNVKSDSEQENNASKSSIDNSSLSPDSLFIKSKSEKAEFIKYLKYLAFSNFFVSVKLKPGSRLFSTSALASCAK